MTLSAAETGRGVGEGWTPCLFASILAQSFLKVNEHEI